MAKHRREEIRYELMRELQSRADSPVSAVAARFGVTRQAVQRHMGALVQEGLVRSQGRAPHRSYRLLATGQAAAQVSLTSSPEEDKIWEQTIRPALNVDTDAGDICYYGFTEIVNNAIDHSA